jgi:hypothetical protein
MDAQLHCRMRSNGYSAYRCPNDDKIKEIHHSCRDRGCSVCGHNKRQQWMDKQSQNLLNCEHFHLVFTLPSEYRVLWLYNREWFIKTQFKVVSETLKDLLESGKGKNFLGATPGFICALHTWGRQLNLHPHIHCLITAGGFDNKGKWKAVENDFLLPVRVLKSLYRGKFQSHIKAFLESGSVNLPKEDNSTQWSQIHKGLYKKEWSVRIQDKYAHGNGVLKYLSRYLGGTPIKPQQIVSMTTKEVSFRYKDHRDGKTKVLRLSRDEFMRRYLMHQPECRVHTFRYYGLYGSQARAKKLRCEAYLGKSPYQKRGYDVYRRLGLAYEVFCDHCGTAMNASYVSFRQRIEKPLIKKNVPQNVQQVDEDRPTYTGLPLNSS